MDNMYENALFSEEIFFTQLARIYMINFNSVNTVREPVKNVLAEFVR